jgi:hypothetical protein
VSRLSRRKKAEPEFLVGEDEEGRWFIEANGHRFYGEILDLLLAEYVEVPEGTIYH